MKEIAAVILVVFGYLALICLQDMRDLLEAAHMQRTTVVVHTVKTESLPVRCRPYYNDGTERWAECMGVGYVDKD
jgi:hypothetical protein